MSIDVIKNIKRIEAEADEIRKKSLEDSRQILSDASAQSNQLLEKSLMAAENEAKDIIIQARKQANSEIEKYNNKISSECEAIKKMQG